MSMKETNLDMTGSSKFKSTYQAKTANETQKSGVKVEDSLKEQMAEMSLGFEDIVKTREEAKKRLQERFDEVYDKIALNKKHVEDQSEKIHTTLANFQDEFNQNLSNLYDNLNETIESESKFMQQEMDLANQRCGELENMLEKEVADRK